MSNVTYCPETGVLTRKGKLCSQRGNADGYLRVMVGGKSYYQHQLAFFLMECRWANEIDHINGDPSDNRWVNLREVTRSQNNMNKSSLNVSRRPHNWWDVRVTKDKVTYQERYKCFGKAAVAAKRLKNKIHGEYSQ